MTLRHVMDVQIAEPLPYVLKKPLDDIGTSCIQCGEVAKSTITRKDGQREPMCIECYEDDCRRARR